jgi:hypothetical protein
MGAKTDEMQKRNNKIVQNNVIKGSPQEYALYFKHGL